ncbi:MAG TPA: S1 RNA-binding domain-containing protein [Firmicutes bacterium]|nr:S1 RNA-binding domain-containing protein [Bacillota bacterium]HHY97596.1 S1 RNA-binding domain-containing protein [Bacillota bacterium]
MLESTTNDVSQRESTFEVGSIIEGRVTNIAPFGAFVELAPGKTGLVHISEIANTYVRDIKDFLKENDIVKVKVISVQNGRVALSIKQADENYRPPKSRGDSRASRQSFEEKLARFMKESEERQQDLKKLLDSKRGGRGTRASRSENF